ncbi:MAG: DUF4118 domain-containing protein [Aeromicrobium sp.]
MEIPAEGAPVRSERILPPAGGGLTQRRRRVGLALATFGLALITAILVLLRDSLELESVLLVYMLAVVIVAVVGGMVAATVAAVLAFLLANWFLTPPYHTFEVERRDSVIALVVFLVVAFTVSATVDIAAKRRVAGVRSQLEAEILGGFTSESVASTDPYTVLEQVRRLFGMRSVALIDLTNGSELARTGPIIESGPTLTADAGAGMQLIAEGPELIGEDRGFLGRLALTAGRAFEGRRLAEEAATAKHLAEIDRVRSALLASVSHDLRTPLAGIKAAVSSLRQQDIEWAEEDEAEFLATIEESTDRLTRLISDLLDMTRLQAGSLSVFLAPVALEEVVARAVAAQKPGDVETDVSPELPLIFADPVLLERVVENVVDNGRRHSPDGHTVMVSADVVEPGGVRLRIVDHGPGVHPSAYESLFVPFQRLGDRSGDGVGLGLAIARGFSQAIGSDLVPSPTPGGGLTMTLVLPVAPASSVTP